jgi:hypothetical protein
MTTAYLSKRLSTLYAFADRHYRSIVFIYFTILLGVGLLLVSDYGISFDEPVSRNNGGISLRYVIERLSIPILQDDPVLALQNTPLMQYHDRDYGVSFDLPAFFIERLFSLNDSRDQYLLRHSLTFLVFFIGVLSIYKLAAIHFNDWRLGLLAATILVTSPRIFGEAFYNNKDIVFMSFVAICMYTTCRLNFSLTWQSAVLHALATALAITVRIPGLIFVLLTLCALTALLILKKVSVKKYLFLGSIYGLTTALTVLMLWPWLWEAPVAHAVQAFRNMARFRWDHYNLYFGGFVHAQHLPWHYAPVWIGITTPLLFVFFTVIGVLHVLADVIRTKFYSLASIRGMQDVMILGIAVGPIVITAMLNSTLYDGWRQLYFVYPGMVFLTIKGAQFFLSRPLLGQHSARLMMVGLSFQIAINLGWIIAHHPNQHLYFNTLAGHTSEQRFEWDYWGVTNFDGLKKILATDQRQTIKIAPIGATSLNQSISLLPRNDRYRITPTEISDEPDYLITNYRFFDGSKFQSPPIKYEPFYKTVVDGREVLTIYRRVSGEGT